MIYDVDEIAGALAESRCAILGLSLPADGIDPPPGAEPAVLGIELKWENARIAEVAAFGVDYRSMLLEAAATELLWRMQEDAGLDPAEIHYGRDPSMKAAMLERYAERTGRPAPDLLVDRICVNEIAADDGQQIAIGVTYYRVEKP